MGNNEEAKVAAAVNINGVVYVGIANEPSYLMMLDTLNEHSFEKQKLLLVGMIKKILDAKEEKERDGLYIITAYIIGLRCAGLEPKPTAIKPQDGYVEITKPRPHFTFGNNTLRLKIGY